MDSRHYCSAKGCGSLAEKNTRLCSVHTTSTLYERCFKIWKDIQRGGSITPQAHDRDIDLLLNFALQIRKEAFEEVKPIIERISEYGPQQGTKANTACAFCDMGGAGYASRGDGFHDDECAVKDAQVWLINTLETKES